MSVRSPQAKSGRRRRGGFRLRVRVPRRLVLGALILLGVPGAIFAGALAYYYVQFSAQIEARLHGERDRVLPRVFARPLELRRGQALGERQLVDRLNDLGYAQRARAEKPGEFAIDQHAIVLIPREGDRTGQVVRVAFDAAGVRRASTAAADAPARVTAIEAGGRAYDRVTLDSPVLTALISSGREKRRQVPLTVIPTHVVQAVLAIEDRRFFSHPGVDPIRIVGAIVTNVRGDKPYLVGASTITQQLVKNFFLTPDKSPKRKLLEQFMALILERKASKDEILELYLNEVYLGQRGSFAIHGMAEAARLYFAKDVSNLALTEGAMLAGMIQSPPALSPFAYPDRCRERRNVVLQAMADTGAISADAAARAVTEPLTVVQRALDAQAPYFVDAVGQVLAEEYPGLTATPGALDVYTTLDIHVQRQAQDAVREGLARVDELLARRKRPRRAQAALIAVDPRTGEVLAMVGGRSYNQSQFNRATNAHRQPGSVFKPFVYLAAFERAAQEGRRDLTPATLVLDEPTTFGAETDQPWSPGNYENEYDGEITLRRALALSRNIATIRVAETTGFDRVAALWKKIGVGQEAHAYPSITLGVFEVSPFEIATAYTLFPNGGEIRPLRLLARVVSGRESLVPATAPTKPVARPDSTYLVTNMMRSVINEGTGAGARAAGFALDAAGKSGTTNDLRDAWFVGFTPELLAVVWVGLDDNQPLGLSGTSAALPIWTTFMQRALSGHVDEKFEAPPGQITWADIDRDTGYLVTGACPRSMTEAFLPGTEPVEYCPIHGF